MGTPHASPELYLSYGMVASKGIRLAPTNTMVFTVSSPPMGLDFFALLHGRHLGAEAKRLLTLLCDAITERIEQELSSENPWFGDGTSHGQVVGWWRTIMEQTIKPLCEQVVASMGGEPSVDALAASLPGDGSRQVRRHRRPQLLQAVLSRGWSSLPSTRLKALPMCSSHDRGRGI